MDLCLLLRPNLVLLYMWKAASKMLIVRRSLIFAVLLELVAVQAFGGTLACFLPCCTSTAANAVNGSIRKMVMAAHSMPTGMRHGDSLRPPASEALAISECGPSRCQHSVQVSSMQLPSWKSQKNAPACAEHSEPTIRPSVPTSLPLRGSIPLSPAPMSSTISLLRI